MIEQLEHYTDATKIQELDEESAQSLYDEAMETALGARRRGLAHALGRCGQSAGRTRYAIAAEEFAYAY